MLCGDRTMKKHIGVWIDWQVGQAKPGPRHHGINSHARDILDIHQCWRPKRLHPANNETVLWEEDEHGVSKAISAQAASS